MPRINEYGKRAVSERISIFEQKKTTTTTTTITSPGGGGVPAGAVVGSPASIRVHSPVSRTFSGKNFDAIKSQFDSRSASPAAAAAATPSPSKTASGGRTSVTVSPNQPPAATTQQTVPPQKQPLSSPRSSVNLNVDKAPQSSVPSTNVKTILKKTNSRPSEVSVSQTPPESKVRGQKVANNPFLQQRASSGNLNKTSSPKHAVTAKSSTTPIKPGGMNINTVTINVNKSELNGNVSKSSTTPTRAVKDKAVTAPIVPTVTVTVDAPAVAKKDSLVKIPEPAKINAPEPVVEDDEDMSGSSPPPPATIPVPARRKSSTKLNPPPPKVDNANNNKTIDVVDNKSYTNNNIKNLVGDRNLMVGHASAPVRGGRSPSYWASQALLNDNSQKLKEVSCCCFAVCQSMWVASSSVEGSSSCSCSIMISSNNNRAARARCVCVCVLCMLDGRSLLHTHVALLLLLLSPPKDLATRRGGGSHLHCLAHVARILQLAPVVINTTTKFLWLCSPAFFRRSE